MEKIVESITSNLPAKSPRPYFISERSWNDEKKRKNSNVVKAEKPTDAIADAVAHTDDSGAPEGGAAPDKNDEIPDNPANRAIREQISALNSEYFKLTKRQFALMRENLNLSVKILETDMEYSSDFDEFVAGLIGKKSAPLERKHTSNESEYEDIEARLEKINSRIKELQKGYER